jgi:hypothetical protein
VSGAEHDTVGKIKREFVAMGISMLFLAMLGVQNAFTGRSGGLVYAREKFVGGGDVSVALRDGVERSEWVLAIVQEERGLLSRGLNGVVICKFCC